MQDALALAQEEGLELIVNGRLVASLFCTPLNLDELAIGHAFARGILTGTEGLLALRICPDRDKVWLEVKEREGLVNLLEPRSIASSCGSGGSSAMETPPRVAPGYVCGIDRIKTFAMEMFAGATLHRETGGMHCAALAGQVAEILLREDVGRHNAVDKVIGRGLLDGAAFGASCILCSGRIALDMVQKAAMAGVPVVATRSIPTTSAFRAAEASGICLIGRISSSSPIVYTHRERLEASD